MNARDRYVLEAFHAAEKQAGVHGGEPIMVSGTVHFTKGLPAAFVCMFPSIAITTAEELISRPPVRRHADYRDAILGFLRQAGERLTGPKIHRLLDQRGLEISDRLLTTILSSMVEDGELQNDHDRRGYCCPSIPAE